MSFDYESKYIRTYDDNLIHPTLPVHKNAAARYTLTHCYVLPYGKNNNRKKISNKTFYREVKGNNFIHCHASMVLFNCYYDLPFSICMSKVL
jgi:hypothetical protein